MSLAVNYTPDPLFSRRAYKRHMARTAKAFSAISMGAAFVLTSGEAFAQSSRASAENGFSPLDGQPIGFNEAGDLRVMLASGEEITIPRGEYGLVGDQIMVSDMIDGVEVAQNGYIPPTSDAYPVYGNTGGGMFGNLGMSTVLIPLGLILGGVLVYFLITRANNDAPVLNASSYTASAPEGTATTSVLFTATATDAEGDTFTFSLSGDDASKFSINSDGEVSFAAVPDFEPAGDASGNNVYSFNVVATDEHGEASSSPASVTLTDTSTAAGTGAYTGTAAAEDISFAAAVVNNIDTAGGNDDILLSAGVGGAVTVTAGTGNDVLTLAAAAMDAGATLDMDAGADTIIINAALAAVPTITLGASDANVDTVDINVLQTAALVIQEWGTEDVLDLTGIATINSFNTTPGAALVANGVSYSISGDNAVLTIDSTGDAVSDMTITLDGVAAIATLAADDVLV